MVSRPSKGRASTSGLETVSFCNSVVPNSRQFLHYFLERRLRQNKWPSPLFRVPELEHEMNDRLTNSTGSWRDGTAFESKSLRSHLGKMWRFHWSDQGNRTIWTSRVNLHWDREWYTCQTVIAKSRNRSTSKFPLDHVAITLGHIWLKKAPQKRTADVRMITFTLFIACGNLCPRIHSLFPLLC